MATRVAVFVPGIMGSVLYRTESGTRDEIWSEDFGKNYNLLVRQDAMLLRRFNVPVKAELLETIYPASSIPLVGSYMGIKLWAGLLSTPRS